MPSINNQWRAAPEFLEGGGELGAMLRARDWSASPLGPPQAWPHPLRTLVAVLLGSNQPMFIAWGPERTLLYNDAYAEVLASKHPDAMGRDFLEVWSEIREDLTPIVEQAYAGQPVHMADIELLMLRKGYLEETHFSFFYAPVRDEAGQVAGLYCACTEITGQIMAERRLLEMNEQLEERVATATRERTRVWEMSRDLFAIMGFDGYLKAINPAWEVAFGRDRETLLSLSFREQVHPDDHAAVESVIADLLEGRTVQRFEDRILHADGSWRWISWTLVPGGDVFHAVGRDVTEEKARGAALRLYENIVQSDRAPVCAFDTDFRLIAFNQAHSDEFFRIFGHRVSLGEVFPDLFPSDQEPIIRGFMARALTGESYTVVEEFGDPDLAKPSWEVSYYPLRDEAGRIIGAFHHAKDISAKLRAEAKLVAARDQLRQAQKMEAMGQLTGGVAHDFNNLLLPIIGSLDMLVRRDVGSERERRLVEGALQAAERAKTLVQRLLAFARRQPLQSTAVDIGGLVSNMAELVGSTLGPMIDVRVSLADQLPAALADANQLEMAILNLAVNARDAMPNGGVLTISATRAVVPAGHSPGPLPGQYIRISLCDTGVGMDEDTRARAVEPFFSTKGIGKGTGLGLSMVHGLASQLGGGLTIESCLGEGTTVHLWLPLSSSPPRDMNAPTSESRAAASRGTALLVDDEEIVRMTTADMLMELGFDVFEASSAREALSLLDEGLLPDLLVTDHLMPGMSGVELAAQVRERRPALPVLIISGYADAVDIRPEMPRLAKPFKTAELASKLAALPSSGLLSDGQRRNLSGEH